MCKNTVLNTKHDVRLVLHKQHSRDSSGYLLIFFKKLVTVKQADINTVSACTVDTHNLIWLLRRYEHKYQPMGFMSHLSLSLCTTAKIRNKENTLTAAVRLMILHPYI